MAQTRFAHKLFEPAPMTISEAKTHCVSIFDKLRYTNTFSTKFSKNSSIQISVNFEKSR